MHKWSLIQVEEEERIQFVYNRTDVGFGSGWYVLRGNVEILCKVPQSSFCQYAQICLQCFSGSSLSRGLGMTPVGYNRIEMV